MKNIKYLGVVVGVSLVAIGIAGYVKSKKTSVNEKINIIGSENKNTEDETGDMLESDKENINQGDIAPDFELKDLDGNIYKLSNNKGKKVYVKFWASWCSICLSGLDELNTLAGENNEFQVITVVSPGFRGEKNEEEFKKWFSGLKYDNVTVLLDEDGDLTNKYQVRGYPTSAVIGSDGILVKTILGHTSNEEIKIQFSNIK
ncbi:MAG: redoxin family protein [Clostridiaceae bacterium]